MALNRLFAQRLFGKSRIANFAVTDRRVSSPCTAALSKAMTTSSKKLASDPSDNGIFHWYFHNQSGVTTGAATLRLLPTGETLLGRIREMDITQSRQVAAAEKKKEEKEKDDACLTVKDVVDILKVSQLEFIKARLKEIEKDQISYSEFVEICRKECSRKDEAIEFAKMLDQSGSVIIIGNIVYIRPEQIYICSSTRCILSPCLQGAIGMYLPSSPREMGLVLLSVHTELNGKPTTTCFAATMVCPFD